jgi:hypothetical protein
LVTIVTQQAPENEWVAQAGDAEIAVEAEALWRKAGERPGCAPIDYVAAARQNIGVRRVMEGFVSLGENCEFGFAQRAYGAEPLDLLRWASTPLRVLLAMLRHRFEGIDAPGVIKVRTARADTSEYMVDNTRYNFSWHAFARVGEVTAEEVHRRECVRLRRLAEKMREDLAEGRRIFTLKGPQVQNAASVAPVVEAMRAYGQPKLLFVTRVEPGRDPGDVVQISDHLLQGLVSRFSDPARVPGTTPVEEWRMICTMAKRICG